LASATGAHAPTLYRLLRTLASLGVFQEDEESRFALTPLGAALQTGPGSMRAMVVHMGEEPSWRAWGDLLNSVMTGESAFKHVHGMEVFPYYAEHPESNEPFNQAMTEYSEAVGQAVTQVYDFSGYRQVIDVGGGHGKLITAILKANPNIKGVLFDLPPAAEDARASLAAAGLAERCETVGGDFFQSVPAGGDLYILKSIIHDWDDERAIKILKNINRAIEPDGKLLLAEIVIAPGPESAISKLSDLHMLIMTGGCERTESEYSKLYEAAGFRLTRIIPTGTLVSLVEGVKA
jgi:SAM-dependent methyltransferase